MRKLLSVVVEGAFLTFPLSGVDYVMLVQGQKKRAVLERRGGKIKPFPLG